MKHVVFALCLALYVVVWGQNWTSYAAAIMAVAWIRHHRQKFLESRKGDPSV